MQIALTYPKDDILADVAAPLRDALRDRYALEPELGRGGMATVGVNVDLGRAAEWF